MLDRRQKKIRRAMAGGALIAIAATLPLWLMDAVWVLGVAAPRFDSHMQGFVYALSLGGVLAGLAAIIGGLEGLLALGINALVARVAKQRTAEPRWMALIIAILGAPFCAVVAAQMFAGRRASQITGKHFIAIGVGLGGVAALYGVARVCVAARDRLRVQRWGKSAALALAALCLALAAALYWTDQRVLPRLYPFFHKALAVGVVICCQLAVYALYAGFRPSSPWIGRLAEPQLALIAVAACVGLCAVSIRQVGRSARLLALSHQHAALQSKALSLARGLRIAPRLRPRGLAAPLAGAGSARGTKPRRNKGAPLAAGPRVPDANLLLITVDALRADHLGVYGYKRKTSPNIDSWAKAGGVVFARGYAAVPHTSFSLTSLMTGKHVYSAGTSRHQTLAAVLRRYGYKTGGFFPPAVFYIDGDRFAAFRAARFDFEYVKYEFLDAKARVDQVLSFLRTQGSKRKVFVWAHFFEPHEPYVAHDGFDFGSRGIDRYDGEIAYVDRQIGRLIRGAMALRKQTSVVLTGDHGEAFGEHSSFYHGNTLYEEQVRVPLIISAPGVKPRFVDGPAQTIDIAATLLSLVDIPVPAGMHGRDLGPWLGGEHAERLPPAFSQIEHKKAVTAGHDKLIYDTVWGYSELYDLKKDPAERENLADQQPGRVRALRGMLASFAAARRKRRRRVASYTERLFARAAQRDPGASGALQRLLERGSLEERRRAARALTRLRARSALAAMRRAAKSRDEGLRIEAVVGGALLGDAELRKQLPKLIQRPDLPPALRRDALLALAGAGDKRVTAELCRVLDASKDIYDRIEIIEALGQLGDVRAAFALRRQLSTLRTRRFAIRALGHIGARSVVPELIAAMRTDRFISVREHAAEALGRIRDQRALADLRAVVRREVEPSVVARALESLGRLDALTVRGVSMLEGKWQCSGDVCRMSLGEHCGASGELVLLVADSVRQLDARCGGRKLAEIDRRAASSQAVPNKSAAGADRPLPPPALVAQLEGKGLLVLTATAPAPEVRFVGLRPTPSAPSPVRPLVPATLPKRKTKAKTKTKTKTSSEAK